MKAQATQIAYWLKKLGMLCLAGLMLCNCARTIFPDPARATLDGHIGHPVSEVILRFGPPKVSFGVGGGKMAFQWDQSVLGQSWATASQEHQGECRLDAIIAIARPARPRAAPSDLQAWTVEAWRFSGAECV
jgi:hypothetical protein